MLKLSPDEIKGVLDKLGYSTVNAYDLGVFTKIAQTAADYAAQHTAEEIVQFIDDWFDLPWCTFEAKYQISCGSVRVALHLWLASQGVEVKAK